MKSNNVTLLKHFISSSEAETMDFATKYLKNISGGCVLGLIGDLGAGKTVFARGIARALGITENITSPTFVIMKIYDTQNIKIKKLIHIDAYRLSCGEDLEMIGVSEYFTRQDCLTIIEWPQQVANILPQKMKFIEISNLNIESRKFRF